MNSSHIDWVMVAVSCCFLSWSVYTWLSPVTIIIGSLFLYTKLSEHLFLGFIRENTIVDFFHPVRGLDPSP